MLRKRETEPPTGGVSSEGGRGSHELIVEVPGSREADSKAGPRQSRDYLLRTPLLTPGVDSLPTLLAALNHFRVKTSA